MKVVALIASGAAVLSSVPSVLGHGYIVDPEAQWAAGYPTNGYGSTVDNEIWGVYDNSVYGYGAEGTLAFFKATFPDSGYDSLGQFITANQVLADDSASADCGLTIYDDSARSTMPESELTYTGFTHPGPCEVWCDDTKVLFDYDCQTTYSEGTMAYDASLCADANRFTIYWLAVHGDPWQVYTDCVWLEGGSGSGAAPSAVSEAASAATTSNSTSTTPTATTAAPTATTTAPTATTAVPTATTAAPTATTAAPTTTSSTAGEAEAPATEAPAATEKCAARRRD